MKKILNIFAVWLINRTGGCNILLKYEYKGDRGGDHVYSTRFPHHILSKDMLVITWDTKTVEQRKV